MSIDLKRDAVVGARLLGTREGEGKNVGGRFAGYLTVSVSAKDLYAEPRGREQQLSKPERIIHD